MNKIIQKDITFEMSFTLPVFGYSKALRILIKNYNANDIKKSWSWKHPFSIDIVAHININHDVDITKMREKQHELKTTNEEAE